MDEFTEKKEDENSEDVPEKKGLIGKLKGLSKVQLLIVGLVFFLIFFSAIIFSFIGDDEEEVKKQAETLKVKVFKTKYKKIKYFDQMTIELNDQNPKRLLNLKFAIELSDENSKKRVEEREEAVKDIVFKLVEQKSFYDLRTVSGKILLKKEMIKSLNEIFGTGRVRNIYFNNFIMYKLKS